MRDNDVRDLLLRVACEVGPPPPTREAMLAAGHRARGRRRMWWAGGSGLAALAAVAVLTQVLSAPGGPAPVAGPGTQGTPSAATASSPAAAGGDSPRPTKSPTGRPVSGAPAAQQQRADAMLAALTAAVPAGYTVPDDPRTRFALVEGWQQTGWLYRIGIDVHRDAQVVTLRVASFTDYGGPGPGDLCAAAYQAAGSYDGCTVLTTSTGVPIAVTWRGGKGNVPREVRAVRVADDRAVSVQQSPRGPHDQPVFTDQQLAEMAVSPDFRG
ncbi:hypothetical protein [Dactylosporangium matsuzakiense]|uniref:Uncharacterized protein n=1 Tax=Dactylosporangium matsuzakiense TaxID=53360 RepID=A0A9W6NNZ6_9ACTN|nr:hypothetical protein [Dactylosporangium matsuzakiense]GLL03552.1 hypothetical protein GCM10017581_052980 [Dactylosporangium matsuzakiense]